MATEQLALAIDVEDALGRGLTPDEEARVDAVLGKASELFRLYSGQTFTEAESTVRLKVNGGRVYLPQSPVRDVLSVKDDDGADVEFALLGQWLTVPLVSHQFVVVNYEHGGDVPDLVRLTVAEIAKRTLTVSEAAAEGVSQSTVSAGPWSESNTYAGWAQGGQTLLSPNDMAVARSFKTSIPNVWVARA